LAERRALGKKGDKYHLIEAKNNFLEINSTCQAKNPQSVSKIKQTISELKKFYIIEYGEGWLAGFYQYANCFADLFFPRELCGVDTEMIFVYFCDDPTYISTSIEEWKSFLVDQKKFMGLGEIDHVSELFFNCNDL